MATKDTIGAALTTGKKADGFYPAPTAEAKRQDVGIASGLLKSSWRPAISVETEVANVRPLTIQIVDGNGDNVAAAVNVVVEVYEATMIKALSGAFTLGLTAGGAGALVSTTGQASVIGTTNAAGLLELDLTDAAGASGKTVEVLTRIVGQPDGLLNGFEDRLQTAFD